MGETYEQKMLRKSAEEVNPEGKSAEEIGEQGISEDYGAPHRSGHDSKTINEILDEKGDYT